MEPAEKKKDEHSGVETTGHEWDGLEELNNPLPRWWLWTFYATIAFSLVYTIAYPAWPLISSSTGGLLGWSSRGALREDLEQLEESRAHYAERLVESDLERVANDPELSQFALAGGASAFKVHCSQCHGAGAAGGGIYPNLVDDDWIWGGSLEEIAWTIRHGVRYEPDFDTRISQMPAFGEILSSGEIRDIAHYVRALSGQEADAEAAERGETPYLDNCSVCHGEMGEGDRTVGAPALDDAIWLYGGSLEEIVAQIAEPRQGVMPAWGDRLSETTIRQLALYVHSLGGGE